LNMRRMDVTLEVSKLSGWLKASAYCSEGSIRQRETRDMEMWHTEERANQQRTHVACVWGRRWSAGRKLTSNMYLMSVTLEVSKLSGRLKASASCRVQRGYPTEGNAWHRDVAWHRVQSCSMAQG
jgi:hypothetical protein